MVLSGVGLTAIALISRFTAPSTLATVISKVPGYEAAQPAGGLASGAMADVTPWPAAKVATRVKKMIIADSIVMGVRK